MNNEFLINCLKEIANAAQAIQLAIIAYVAYVEGSNAAEVQAEAPTEGIVALAQLTNNIITIKKEEEKASEITSCNEQVEEEIQVTFTEKELYYMPMQFRKEYRMDGTVIRCRKRPTGYNKYTYEMRYRRDGYNVTATAKTLEACKAKFIQKLKEADASMKNKDAQGSKTNFKNFALYYYETFKKRKVAESTYKTDINRLKLYLIPRFGEMELCKITPNDCQELIDKYVNEGKGKTAECIHSLLNQLFKSAIKHGYLTQNPIDLVVKEKHEREHGKALTLKEEAEFVAYCKNAPYAELLITALYTGMRPNEYAHAEFKNGFVVTINSKRKNGKVEYKKIPIHPMLEPHVTTAFINNFNKCKTVELASLRKFAKNNLEQWIDKPYDLRTTFYTRCEMCGVSESARNEFVGHSGGVLKDAYTDLPDSYLIQEGKKLRYNLEF